MGEHNEIVLRNYLRYFSGPVLSKAWARSIAASGKARLTNVVGQVGQGQNTGTDLIRFLEI
jgi:hypothetical protein